MANCCCSRASFWLRAVKMATSSSYCFSCISRTFSPLSTSQDKTYSSGVQSCHAFTAFAGHFQTGCCDLFFANSLLTTRFPFRLPSENRFGTIQLHSTLLEETINFSSFTKCSGSDKVFSSPSPIGTLKLKLSSFA